MDGKSSSGFRKSGPSYGPSQGKPPFSSGQGSYANRPVGNRPFGQSGATQRTDSASYSSGNSNSYQRNQRNDSNNPRARMMYVNDQIKAPTIMIINDEKQNIGTFPRRRALELAEEAGLDLVQITYDPEKMLSTVRLTDYGKYMYQKGKEEKEKKRQQKGKDMKEIKISYGIGENDLALKIRKAEEFLKDGDNVKVSIKLKGRERMYANKALEKILAVKQALIAFGRSQYETPKKEAQGYSIILFSK